MRTRSRWPRYLKWTASLLLVCLVIIWVLSYTVDVSYRSEADNPPVFHTIALDNGGIWLSQVTTDAPNSALRQLRRNKETFGAWLPPVSGWEVAKRTTGMSTIHAKTPFFPSIQTIVRPTPCQTACTCGLGEQCQIRGRSFLYLWIWIPFWIPSTLLMVLILACFWVGRRFPAAQCQACGYDLRGVNHDRCPECGHVRRAGTDEFSVHKF